jgi:hypothetical protein
MPKTVPQMMSAPPSIDSNDPLRIKLEVDLAPEAAMLLRDLSRDRHWSFGDVLRNAIGLLKVAVDAHDSGKHLAIVDENFQVEQEVIGF